MLTTPITTPHFHSRVLTLLSNHLDELDEHPERHLPIPTIPPLTPVDTPLTPGDTISQLLAVVNPRIDLCSPDPVIYDISRQVLALEVSYAAFCGVGNIIMPSPKLHHGKLHGDGVTRYAYAVQEALKIGNYVQLSITLPIFDTPDQDDGEVVGSFAEKARGRFLGLSQDIHQRHVDGESDFGSGGSINRSGSSRKRPLRFDLFGTWDAWNVIRTVCKYNSRLFVGKNRDTSSLLPSSILV